MKELKTPCLKNLKVLIEDMKGYGDREFESSIRNTLKADPEGKPELIILV